MIFVYLYCCILRLFGLVTQRLFHCPSITTGQASEVAVPSPPTTTASWVEPRALVEPKDCCIFVKETRGRMRQLQLTTRTGILNRTRRRRLYLEIPQAEEVSGWCWANIWRNFLIGPNSTTFLFAINAKYFCKFHEIFLCAGDRHWLKLLCSASTRVKRRRTKRKRSESTTSSGAWTTPTWGTTTTTSTTWGPGPRPPAAS